MYNVFSNTSIDGVFIDGLHTKEGVENDISAYLPKVKSAGCLIFNDYDDNTTFEAQSPYSSTTISLSGRGSLREDLQ